MTGRTVFDMLEVLGSIAPLPPGYHITEMTGGSPEAWEMWASETEAETEVKP